MVAAIALVTHALLAQIMVVDGVAGWIGGQASMLRWGLLAPVALVALAVLIAAPRGGRLRLSCITAGLILAFWAPDPLVTGFGLLTAIMLAAFCADAQPLLLGAAPALILEAIGAAIIAQHGLIASVSAAACLVLAALLAPLGALFALRAHDFTGLARGFVLGLFGVALGGVGLGLASVTLIASAGAALIAGGLLLIEQRLTETAGHIALDWLGGLARGMPELSFVLLALMLGVSVLPPGPAFDLLVLIAQALGPAPSLSAGAFFLGTALWAALSSVAALRGFALVALGRPRSLRAAAAEDQRDRLWIAMASLAAAMLLLGLIVVPDRLVVILMTSCCAVLVALLVASVRKRRLLELPHWTEGFAKPPLWLPFDDPKTQMTATGFAAITLGVGVSLPGWLRDQSNVVRLWLRTVLAP
ncbi:MAG TPA: hypothetical protein PK677_06250 [Acidiphilium sp.]|nr:MAG: hypothetical protein B7Z67_11020 [Acidiphilium sp. 21-60-14]OYV90646.1 MAG: hypothetical protein B7Z57_08505 [Acidiphilium sp. 37-60-79]OZB38563.1 MAG: hypothetical protein B7X48_12690 [Acidiphilium sp. 34-60-192]HQT88140.1 hypothetical protein [Acidiphilium sp.]HQU24240.1 hypothetical protein [Acidiphilium sp.]